MKQLGVNYPSWMTLRQNPPMADLPPFKKLTLEDVARQLGVSRATVSNAFNKPELLAKAKLERIKSGALELGYFGPDPMARAMRRKELQEVAVVFHHDLRYALSDPVSVEFLRGVASELDARDLALHLIPKTGRRANTEAAFQTTADALIIHDAVAPEFIPQLMAMRKPLTLVDTRIAGLASVEIDDRLGARNAMDYVLGKKPDQVVVLSLPLDEDARAMTEYKKENTDRSHVSTERVTGYLESLKQHAFDRSKVRWIEVLETNTDAGGREIVDLLGPKLQKLRVGVVAMTDRIALSVLQELDARAWSRPVAMVGFDDIPDAARCGLTTIRQNAYEKGVLAVRTALDRLGPVCLPTELVVRET